MNSCLLLVILVNFVCSGIADRHHIKKCDVNADIPEPPCCGTPMSLEGRIYKNKSTPILNEEVPFFVTVKHTWKGGIGALLNTRWVITAAHCIVPAGKIGSLQVRIPNVGRIAADFWAQHPLYSRGAKKFDIALVRMERPVTITKATQPICLPLSPQFKTFDFSGKNVTILGWSSNKIGDKKVNKAKAIATLRSKKKCNWSIGLCTDRILYGGDSGSPMNMISNFNPLKLKARYLVGIYSLVACCSMGKTGVFVKVDESAEWIKAVILANK